MRTETVVLCSLVIAFSFGILHLPVFGIDFSPDYAERLRDDQRLLMLCREFQAVEHLVADSEVLVHDSYLSNSL